MPAPTQAKLISKTPITSDVIDIRFQVDTPSDFVFEPGQFMTLSVGTNEQGRPIRRSYSLASRQSEKQSLRFLLKLVSDGPGSEFFSALEPGAQIDLTGPHGFFTLLPEHPGDIVFAATGTGIAPILPMLDGLGQNTTTPAADKRVYWGLRHESDIFVQKELEALCEKVGAKLHIYLSKPTESWTGAQGHITPDIVRAAKTLANPVFYLVGNGAMIREAKQGLLEAGLNRKKQIRTEAFFD